MANPSKDSKMSLGVHRGFFRNRLSRFVDVRLPFQCRSFRHEEIVPGLGLFCGKVQADFFRKPTMALGASKRILASSISFVAFGGFALKAIKTPFSGLLML